MSSLSKLIAKATDANLTSDDWALNFEVVDEINSSPEKNALSAVELFKQRLSQTPPNGNVLIRTLNLMLACSENCGSRFNQQISSEDFLDKVLRAKVMKNAKVHNSVKTKVVEVVGKMKDSTSVKNDPSLSKPLEKFHKKLFQKYPGLAHAVEPDNSIFAPAKPKKERNDAAWREEQELKQAMELSLKDHRNVREPVVGGETAVSRQEVVQPAPGPPPKITKVRALYALASNEPDELSFDKGDVIHVLKPIYKDWWQGALNGNTGIFPLNYVVPIYKATPEQEQRELQEENNVLQNGRMILEVDELIHMLTHATTSGSTQNAAQIDAMYSLLIKSQPFVADKLAKYEIQKQELVGVNQLLLKSDREFSRRTVEEQEKARQYQQQQLFYPSLAYGNPRSPYPTNDTYLPQAPETPTPWYTQYQTQQSVEAPRRDSQNPQAPQANHPQANHPQANHPQANHPQSPYPQAPYPQAPYPQAPSAPH